MPQGKLGLLSPTLDTSPDQAAGEDFSIKLNIGNSGDAAKVKTTIAGVGTVLKGGEITSTVGEGKSLSIPMLATMPFTDLNISVPMKVEAWPAPPQGFKAIIIPFLPAPGIAYWTVLVYYYDSAGKEIRLSMITFPDPNPGSSWPNPWGPNYWMAVNWADDFDWGKAFWHAQAFSLEQIGADEGDYAYYPVPLGSWGGQGLLKMEEGKAYKIDLRATGTIQYNGYRITVGPKITELTDPILSLDFQPDLKLEALFPSAKISSVDPPKGAKPGSPIEIPIKIENNGVAGSVGLSLEDAEGALTFMKKVPEGATSLFTYKGTMPALSKANVKVTAIHLGRDKEIKTSGETQEVEIPAVDTVIQEENSVTFCSGESSYEFYGFVAGESLQWGEGIESTPGRRSIPVPLMPAQVDGSFYKMRLDPYTQKSFFFASMKYLVVESSRSFNVVKKKKVMGSYQVYDDASPLPTPASFLGSAMAGVRGVMMKSFRVREIR